MTFQVQEIVRYPHLTDRGKYGHNNDPEVNSINNFALRCSDAKTNSVFAKAALISYFPYLRHA